MAGSQGNDAVVIVTGAARGLGRAMALGLAQAGYRVGALDLAASEAEMGQMIGLAKQRGLGDRILPLHGDVTRPADCAGAVEAVARHFGGVFGLVNNAGLGMQHIGPVVGEGRKRFYEVDANTWRSSIDVNINGPFLMAQAIAPRLVAQGAGRIVNIVTSYFAMVMEGFSPYGPSKAALEAATVVWSKDLAKTGVTVNALLPGGPANTRMIPTAEVTDRSKLVQPEAMVMPICWIMSRAADGITGQRFVAQDWDPQIAPEEAARKARAPAGW